MNFLQKLILGKDLVNDIETRSSNFSTTFVGGKMFRSYSEVTKDELLSIPTAKKILGQLVETMSSFEIELFENHTTKGQQKKDDYRHKLLNKESNPFLSGFAWKERLFTDLILNGDHYSYVKRKGNKILGLYPVDSVVIKYAYDEMGLPTHKLIEGTINGRKIVGDYTDFFHIESVNGGVLSHGKVLRQLLDERDAMNEALQNGSYIDKVLQAQGRLSQSTIEGLKASFDGAYSGENRGKRTILLEEGIDLKSINNDSPLIPMIEAWEKRELKQISLLFGLPSTQTLDCVNISVKQLGTLLLQQVYLPMCERVEVEIGRQLLLETEKESHTVKFNTSNLVRLDEAEKANLYTQLFKDGVISKNQLADLLYLPKETEDYYHMNLASVLLYKEDVDREAISNKILNLNTIATEVMRNKEVDQQSMDDVVVDNIDNLDHVDDEVEKNKLNNTVEDVKESEIEEA